MLSKRLLVVCIGLLCGIGCATVQPSKTCSIYEPIRFRDKQISSWDYFNKAHQYKWKVLWNPLTDTPHRISGGKIEIKERLTADNVERITRNLLSQYRDLLQIKVEDLVLQRANFQAPRKHGRGSGSWYIHYRQTYKGLPVLGGSVWVVIRNQNVTQLGSDFYPGIRVPTKPSVSRQQAIKRASRGLTPGPPLKPVAHELLIFPQNVSGTIRYHLAWAITMPVTYVPKHVIEISPVSELDRKGKKQEMVLVQWRFFVSALTGSIIARTNILRSVDPLHVRGKVTGRIYPISPNDPQQEVPISGMTVQTSHGDQAFTTDTDHLGVYQHLWLGEVPAVVVDAQLWGSNVRVYNNETPDPDATHHAVLDTDTPDYVLPTGRYKVHCWNWAYDDHSPNDVETNAFYHVNLVHDWFSRGGAFYVTPTPPPDAEGDYVEVFVRNGPGCAAGASVGCGTLFFGSGDGTGGRRDHALCANVIYHEYTHLVVYEITLGALDLTWEGHAIDEALADYFAATITNDPEINRCSNSSRNIDTPDRRYPDYFMKLDYHYDGLILSGALWDLRASETLKSDYVDSMTMRALCQATPTTFVEFLSAIIHEDDDHAFSTEPSVADNDPANGSPNIHEICHAFYDMHGIYHGECAGYTDTPVAVITSPSPLPGISTMVEQSTGVIEIVGSAHGSRAAPLQNFTIEYENVEIPGVWLTHGITLRDNGTIPVDDTVLGIWDITEAQSGVYVVRLTVTDLDGNQSVATASITLTGDLLPGWPQGQGDDLYFLFPPVVADIDPEYPGLEVLARETWGNLYIWHADGTQVDNWPQRIGGIPSSSPTIADLDSDGNPEIISVRWDSGSGTRVVVNDITGHTVWFTYCTGSEASPELESICSVGNVDDDVQWEVALAVPGGKVCVWNHDGSLATGWPVALDDSDEIERPLAIGDVDNDGQSEIIASTLSGHVYVWNGDGSTLPGWPQDLGATAQAAPALADLDGDGDLEILVGSATGVHIWHHDGQIFDGWPKNVAIDVPTSLVIADMDNNGVPEILLQNNDRLYVWRSDGRDFLPEPVVLCGKSYYHSPVVNGSKIIVTANDCQTVHNLHLSKIFAINADGSPVADWPKTVAVKWEITSPVLADVDLDGDLEILVGNYDGVFIWDLPDHVSLVRREWADYRHDTRRTGHYIAHVDVPRRADLIATDLIFSLDSPTVGQRVTFLVTVKNVGRDLARASMLEFKLVGMSGIPLDPPIEILDMWPEVSPLPKVKVVDNVARAAVPIPPIAPQGAYTIKGEVIIGIAQQYQVTVTVDAGNDIDEVVETNNEISKTMQVQTPNP